MNKLDEILLSRACKYGAFEDTAKRTERIYHHMVYNAPEFVNKNDMSVYYEALRMIALKIARLVNGGIKDTDGWLDISGYAMLVHNHIVKEQEDKKASISGVSNGHTHNILLDGAIMKAMEEQIAAEIETEQ